MYYVKWSYFARSNTRGSKKNNTFHYLSWEHSIFIGSKLSSNINVVDLI